LPEACCASEEEKGKEEVAILDGYSSSPRRQPQMPAVLKNALAIFGPREKRKKGKGGGGAALAV